jgi:hypothetical protein
MNDQGSSSFLNEKGKMSLAHFLRIKEELEMTLDHWRRDLDVAYKAHPRLLFFDARQLSKLLKRLRKLKVRLQRIEHASSMSLALICTGRYSRRSSDFAAATVPLGLLPG